ncbi:hypothetical protein BACCAC_02457 [Bacteroides caccae ATCC 43185]|nr:hypothetical protein BACCAC_02457 [Bacteroides caccae ATCC 43185]
MESRSQNSCFPLVCYQNLSLSIFLQSLSTPIPLAPQTERPADNVAYRKEKRRGKIPSLTLNHVLDIQIFHRQSIIVLPEKSFVDELQTKCLIILIVAAFGAEVFVPISWCILLEEPYKFVQFHVLLLGKVAVYKNDAPVWKAAHTFAILPKANVEFYGLDIYAHATTVHCRYNVKAVSVTEPLANVEVKIQ